MREIPLSSKKYPGLVALVDDERYEEVAAHNWHPWKAPTHSTLYARTNVRRADGSKTVVYMHRFLFSSLGAMLDHRNNNGLDNRQENIRPADHSQNKCNRGPQSNNTSGYKGVSWQRSSKKWMAKIHVGSQKKYLGLFSEAAAAARAYDDAALKLHGEFASLNFPKDQQCLKTAA